MNDIKFERTCMGPNCGAEFVTYKTRQMYCSYQCYYNASKGRSMETYRKIRASNPQQLISKICKDCHEEFQTSSLKKIYCSHACYHNACLEKNREYMQKVRDEHKARSQKKNIRECELCSNKFTYTTNSGKYCDSCKPLGAKLKRGMPENISPMYAGLKPGDTVGATKPKTFGGGDAGQTENSGVECWICHKMTAPDKETPCTNCNS